jgi:hypothetical protein
MKLYFTIRVGCPDGGGAGERDSVYVNIEYGLKIETRNFISQVLMCVGDKIRDVCMYINWIENAVCARLENECTHKIK